MFEEQRAYLEKTYIEVPTEFSSSFHLTLQVWEEKLRQLGCELVGFCQTTMLLTECMKNMTRCKRFVCYGDGIPELLRSSAWCFLFFIFIFSRNSRECHNHLRTHLFWRGFNHQRFVLSNATFHRRSMSSSSLSTAGTDASPGAQSYFCPWQVKIKGRIQQSAS